MDFGLTIIRQSRQLFESAQVKPANSRLGEGMAVKLASATFGGVNINCCKKDICLQSTIYNQVVSVLFQDSM